VKLPIWLASVGLDIPISTCVVAGETRQGEFVLRLHEGAPSLAFDGSTGSQSFDPSSPVAKERRFPSSRLAVDAITRNLSYHGRRCELSTRADESRSELSTGLMKPRQILSVRSVELSNAIAPKAPTWRANCRCFTTDSLPRRYSGQFVWALAYAELDGKRKRQSIYPGSGPRP